MADEITDIRCPLCGTLGMERSGQTVIGLEALTCEKGCSFSVDAFVIEDEHCFEELDIAKNDHVQELKAKIKAGKEAEKRWQKISSYITREVVASELG